MSRWFRMYVGSFRDPKFRDISRQTNQPVATVFCVWQCILESAAEKNDGGIFSISNREVAFLLGCDVDGINAIRACMDAAGLTDGDMVAKWSANYREFPPDWPSIRTQVFTRDSHTCQYCGATGCALECDHVHPASRGGGHELANLATACVPCNRSKRDKTLEEWVGAQ